MGPVAIFWAAATGLTMLLARKRRDALVASLVIAGQLAITDAMNGFGVAPTQALDVNVWLDTAAAIGFVLAWRIIWPPRNWLFVLALSYFAQVVAHRIHDGQTDSWALYRLEVVLAALLSAQLLIINIGPRAGEIWRFARDLFTRLFAAPRVRVRPRGVVASADAFIQRVGAAALREKSR